MKNQKEKINYFGIRKNKTRFTLGFGLIEMIVSVGIFSIVMLVATGALLTLVGVNQKTRMLRNAVDNVGLAMESMSRTIRTGRAFECGGTKIGVITGGQSTPSDGSLSETADCQNGSSLMSLIDEDGTPVTYRLNNGVIEKYYYLPRPGYYAPMTDPLVRITNLKFIVTGSTYADLVQPKVIISVQGYADVQGSTPTKNRTYFNLQSAVSQRTLDTVIGN